MLWVFGLIGALIVLTVAFLNMPRSAAKPDRLNTRFDDFIDEHGLGNLSTELQSMNPPPAEGDTMPAALDLGALECALKQDPSLDAALDLSSVDIADEDVVLVWDDRAGPEPKVQLALSETNADILDIKLGKEVVAHVPVASGLTSENITLVPISVAEEIGWSSPPDAPLAKTG